MIHICLVVKSNSEVLSHERSFDGGDYTLKVEQQCEVYLDNEQEVTDSDIIILRCFALQFYQSEIVDTTWTSLSWYDNTRILLPHECHQLLAELNSDAKRYSIVDSFQSLCKNGLLTSSEIEFKKREAEKDKTLYSFSSEIKKLEKELEEEILAKKREFSEKSENIYCRRKNYLYNYYRNEILCHDYSGNTFIDDLDQYLIEIALENNDDDFLTFYLNKYYNRLFGDESEISHFTKKIAKLLCQNLFIDSFLAKAETLVRRDIYLAIIDSLIGIISNFNPKYGYRNGFIVKLYYLKIDYSIKRHDIETLAVTLDDIFTRYTNYKEFGSENDCPPNPLAIIRAIGDYYDFNFGRVIETWYSKGYTPISIDKTKRSRYVRTEYDNELKTIFRWWYKINNSHIFYD